MNQKIKQFIEENKNLIEEDQWRELYRKAYFQLTPMNIGAFTNCLYQAEINPLNYLDKVPPYYFAFCNPQDLDPLPFKNIELPPNIKSVKAFSFEYSEFDSITLPQGLTSIGVEAFLSCKFKELFIPNSLKTIGRKAFSEVGAEQRIIFKGSLKEWKSLEKTFPFDWDEDLSIQAIICNDGRFIRAK